METPKEVVAALEKLDSLEKGETIRHDVSCHVVCRVSRVLSSDCRVVHLYLT